jgi:hypothetical protein
MMRVRQYTPSLINTQGGSTHDTDDIAEGGGFEHYLFGQGPVSHDGAQGRK